MCACDSHDNLYTAVYTATPSELQCALCDYNIIIIMTNQTVVNSMQLLYICRKILHDVLILFSLYQRKFYDDTPKNCADNMNPSKIDSVSDFSLRATTYLS